jgi:hypothetical protein
MLEFFENLLDRYSQLDHHHAASTIEEKFHSDIDDLLEKIWSSGPASHPRGSSTHQWGWLPLLFF